jgi:hypothetical protein
MFEYSRSINNRLLNSICRGKEEIMTRFSLCFLWLGIFGFCFACPQVWAAPASPPFGVYDGAPYSPTVTVLESDTVIRLDLSMDNLPHGGTVDMSTQLPGLWGEMNPLGARLPRFTIYVALPGTGNPTVSEELWNDTTFQATPHTLTDNATQPSHVTLGAVGILGGVRIVPVNFRPISYVNNASTGTVMRHAIIRISVDDSQGTNPVTTPRLAFSRPWQRLYQTVITNWEYIPNIGNGEQSHILMIVPDVGTSNYVPSVQNFVRWKEQRGFKVTVLPLSSIGSNPSSTQLRNRIISELAASSPRIDYVILVGDETKLPVSMLHTDDPATIFSNMSDSGDYTNELAFAAVEGDDVFPDVFLGRWVVNTTQDVLKIATRSIAHERDTFAGDSARFAYATVAADEATPSQVTTKRRVREMLVDHGYASVDTIWGHDHGTWMSSSINQGRAFVNYRGEGWNYGWYGIDFYVFDIPNLTNTNRLPIVTGIGCGVGIFNDPQDDAGFGEAFMLGGTIANPTGAVGFIGPCWNTHTVFNDCLDSLLYRGWLEYGNLNLSPGLVVGKMMNWAMFSVYLNDAAVFEVTKTMMRQFHVESDPSLQVFTKTPVRLQVSAPDTVHFGSPQELAVSVLNWDAVDAESLNVTLWQNDSTATTRWLAPHVASLSIPFVADSSDTLIVTITGDNVLAFQKMVFALDAPEAAPDAKPFKPALLELQQNFPNPFNPETTLEFTLPNAVYVRLDIYDLLGRRVATLVQGNIAAGAHRLVWNGKLEGGANASSGVYYCRLTTENQTLSRKMLLLR